MTSAGRSLEKWAELHSGTNPRARQQAMIAFAADLRSKLAGSNPNALELLLAERVTLAWLFVNWAECQLAGTVTKVTVAMHNEYLKRVELANRVFMAACRTLAKVRRSKLPDIVALVNMQPPVTPPAKKSAGRKIVVG